MSYKDNVPIQALRHALAQIEVAQRNLQEAKAVIVSALDILKDEADQRGMDALGEHDDAEDW